MALTKERTKLIYITFIIILLFGFVGIVYRHMKQNPPLKLVNHKFQHLPMIPTNPKDEIVEIRLLPDTSTTVNRALTQERITKNANATAEYKLGPTDGCLHCLCETINGCRPVKCLKKYTCGIYEISKFYWIDAGALTTTNNLNDFAEEKGELGDYLRCVNDMKCSSETVVQYTHLYQRDCNNDGIIDCQDYIALHLLGPKGCRNRQLTTYHKIRMNSCLKL